MTTTDTGLPFDGWWCAACRRLVDDGLNPHNTPGGVRCRTNLIIPVQVIAR